MVTGVYDHPDSAYRHELWKLICLLGRKIKHPSLSLVNLMKFYMFLRNGEDGPGPKFKWKIFGMY